MPGKPAAPAPELETIHFETAADFAAWLEEHHATSPGIWLRLAKKNSAVKSVSYMEAVEAGLCHGWIDSMAKSLDADSYIQKFTPRKAKSIWSKINTEKAEELIKAGKMRPGGMKAIEAAKADGRWEQAYDSPTASTIPDDLRQAFDANPKAAAFFATLNAASRYAVLWRVQTARKPETRARRIDTLVRMLERGEKLHP